MVDSVRTTFQDRLTKLHCLVLELASEVKDNGDLLFEVLKNKDNIHETFELIKAKDKQIDKARWLVHDKGDELLVLESPVASDFRQIVTAIQVTDNLERIGDHFKKTAKLLDKADLSGVDVPEELIQMAELGNNMLSKAILAYANIKDRNTNDLEKDDDAVDALYKTTVKKIISIIKSAPEENVDALSKMLFIAQSFERAADHSAKIGNLVNFAVTGKRNK